MMMILMSGRRLDMILDHITKYVCNACVVAAYSV